MRPLAMAALLGLSVGAASTPALALDEPFVDTSWDPATWSVRQPLTGSRARTGVASTLAVDGFEGRLIYPSGRPTAEWGPRYATQISATESRLYGDYTIRMRGGRGANDTEGVISALFTYYNDGVDWDGDGLIDNHEIDIELSACEPSVLYLTVWTDYDDTTGEERFHRVGARVDLSTGVVLSTPPGGETGWDTVETALPFTVPGFRHVAQYHTYGFEWRYDRVTFWIDLEDGFGRRDLWEVTGDPDGFIPSLAAPTYLNTWHNPVNWYSRADAPPPSTNAIFRIDHVSVTDPGPGCADDAACDDGNPCDGFEVCADGRCFAGADPSCDDADACTTETCSVLDPSTWECIASPISCDDGNACTVDTCDASSGCASTPVVCAAGEACSGGVCVAIPACFASNVDCSANAQCCSGKCRGGTRRRCL